jgi:hypothetical protein
MFGSGATAVWARAATEDNNKPAVMNGANLLWIIMGCVSFAGTVKRAPEIAHHPLV